MTTPRPPFGATGTATAREQRSRLVRTLVGMWLVVHAVVIAAAPIADALTEQPGAIVAHWEDAQETNCPPRHDPSVCQFCQVVSATFGGREADALAAARLVSVASEPPVGGTLAADSPARRASPHPRGPPTV